MRSVLLAVRESTGRRNASVYLIGDDGTARGLYNPLNPGGVSTGRFHRQAHMCKSAHSWRQHPLHDRGFTLFEVMIALLVLSIGLLGLAALQTRALRTGQAAEMHTRAGQLAADLLERMRANPAGVASGRYDHNRRHPPRHVTASGMAGADLAAWAAGLAKLPDGQGEIRRCTAGCAHGAGHPVYSVTVWWNAARDPAVSGLHCPPRSDADLRCVRLVLR
jgi:type IV pilus assembly protein PilV